MFQSVPGAAETQNWDILIAEIANDTRDKRRKEESK